MIISVSRRTDIPAFYSEWFINRLQAGYVYIKSPRNSHRSSRVVLNPEVVDCIVFWTKNAAPMMKRLDTIDGMGYKYYFQYTITPYGSDIETGLPPKTQIMNNFKRLSDKIGKHRMVWRYDPIIINRDFSAQYHIDSFEKMCSNIGNYAYKCIFSFIDLYPKVKQNVKCIVDNEVSVLNMRKLAQEFAEIAQKHNLPLSTCSEAIDLSEFHVQHAACIDPGMVEDIIGSPITARKDLNQREHCGCMESIDIGHYDSCSHGCVYCYATMSWKNILKNIKNHDKNSPILIGQPGPEDVITERKVKSLRNPQLSLFQPLLHGHD